MEDYKGSQLLLFASQWSIQWVQDRAGDVLRPQPVVQHMVARQVDQGGTHPELASFFGCRLLTGALDVAIMAYCVDFRGGDRTLEPHGCEPCALPAELQAQIGTFYGQFPLHLDDQRRQLLLALLTGMGVDVAGGAKG